ncbi:fimbrial protein [Serratia rubidaea]|uniref:fimbrial protein n=1 Tax=Serratia rubidaea TaxID=61652 RepID=UPI00242AFBF2|nr:fimbrial protein [Serratia rubidaea]MCR0997288.1 fimbrial protein [Serratia rubidaea]
MKLKSIFRKLSFASLLTVAGVYVPQTLAAPAPGTCVSEGGTQKYPFTFETSFDSPDKNTTGMIIENASQDKWNISQPYFATCGCSTMNAAYFSAVPLLKGLDYIDPTGWEYHILNDFLSVASKVHIAGGLGKDVQVPFTNISNRNGSYEVACSGKKNEYYSGAKGTINLRFRRPFVGVQVIPPTRLVEVYMSSTSGVTSPTPVSYVMMSGSVTVPQNCEISPQPVTVNFGDIASTEFKEKGKMPKNFTPHHKELTLACRNISDGVKISLSFQGEADPNDATALKSTNKDIAVKVEDSLSSDVISPNNGRLPVMMNYTDQTGKTGINVYPINTSNEMPEVGVFNSTATIRVEIE